MLDGHAKLNMWATVSLLFRYDPHRDMNQIKRCLVNKTKNFTKIVNPDACF